VFKAEGGAGKGTATRVVGVTKIRLACVIYPPEDGAPIIAPSNGVGII